MISRTAEYALRAVLHLAQHAGEAPVRAELVADALGAPRNALSKVLHVLARAGVLASLRGPAGGFTLAVPAAALTLDAVVAPFEGVPRRRRCLLGRTDCSGARPCGAHAEWTGVVDRAVAFFHDTTVAMLLDAAAGGGASGPGAAADT